MIKDGNKRVVLIVVLFLFGKISFVYRLLIYFRVNNLNFILIFLDDYFIDRKYIFLDEYGNYDFELIYVIDLEKFNLDLKKFLVGEEIDDIRFNFKEGKREYIGKKIKIDLN